MRKMEGSAAEVEPFILFTHKTEEPDSVTYLVRVAICRLSGFPNALSQYTANNTTIAACQRRLSSCNWPRIPYTVYLNNR